MAERMTLVEVRDALKSAWVPSAWSEGRSIHKMTDLIAAIDAHLAQPAQAALYARCEDCSEPTGKTAVCITCAELRCDSVLRAAQAVDVGAIREVIAEATRLSSREFPEFGELSDKLTRATGNAQAEWWKVPEAVRKGFMTSESCGPDKHYVLKIAFRSLGDLQAAHRAMLTPPTQATHNAHE